MRATLRSEWAKLRTARAPRRNLVLGAVLGVVPAALVALLLGATYDDLSPTEKAEFDPILYPLTGSILSAIFFVAVGVGLVAPEYRTGMVRLTFLATPRRGRVLVAKAVVAAVATGVVGAVTSFGMVVPAQLVLRSQGAPSAGLGDGALWRAVVVLGLVGPVFPVLGVAAAFLFRSAAAALCSTLALVFVPGILGELLPPWWRRNVVSLMPGAASDSLAIGHLVDDESYLALPAAALVVAAWVALGLGLAAWWLERRDA